MSEKVKRLLEAARELTPVERAEFREAFDLVNDECENLPFDPEWLDEIDRRVAELDRGEARTYSWEEVKEFARRDLPRNE